MPRVAIRLAPRSRSSRTACATVRFGFSTGTPFSIRMPPLPWATRSVSSFSPITGSATARIQPRLFFAGSTAMNSSMCPTSSQLVSSTIGRWNPCACSIFSNVESGDQRAIEPYSMRPAG